MRRRLKLALFGLPGAGKGTQAELLSKYLGVPHVSTGDMFRSLQANETPTAALIREIISVGKLVPDDLVTEMAFERLSCADAAAGFVLDGFPRTLPQAIALQGSEHALDALIEIRVDKEEIVRRLSGRRVCATCRAIYHVDNLPAGANVCPQDSGDLVQRADDMPEAVTVRLDLFEANLAPLVHFFEERRLLWTINGLEKPEVVFRRLLEVVGRLACA